MMYFVAHLGNERIGYFRTVTDIPAGFQLTGTENVDVAANNFLQMIDVGLSMLNENRPLRTCPDCSTFHQLKGVC